jgi:sugar phosphate isomerase/epimerase
MKTTRRDFIKSTTAAGSALLVDPLKNLAKAKPIDTVSGFSLIVLATNWGLEGTMDDFCAKAKAAGYDGIEVWYPANEKDRSDLQAAIGKHQLKVGFLVGSGESNYQKHFDVFKQNLEAAVKLKPLYINCHSGRDYFSFDQNKRFVELSIQVANDSSVPVYHETHRSRIMYSAPVTRQFIESIPQLKLTLDISHWCNVHESLLQDQKETIDLALNRTEHIHARIGHPEGPQVNDPRAPEWDVAVKTHFAWWDMVLERKKKEGKPMTMLTEFGPPDYMPATPYTRQPLANQWEINVYMMQTLRKRYL